jgi:thioesterase domain-containing protein/acyl carrier protein
LSASVDPAALGLAVVQNAWMQTLDTEHCDFTQTWEQAGGDSLATLHLLLRLERVFGRKLPFDMMRPEMRASDLAALLLNVPHAPAAPTTRSALTASLPLVHLMPGLFGDEPRLATFRRALAGRIRFHVVALPEVGAPAVILGDMQRTGALAARDIQARQPTGAILLAGYSFGGCVAMEAARALAAAGRDIALLAILDAPFGRAAEGTTRTVRQCLRPTAIKFSVGRWACSWDAGRRAWLRLVKPLGLSAEIAAKRFVWLVFRERARHRWAPAVLDVDTWLAVSAQQAPKTLSIWQRLCGRLRIVHLPGAHLDIFQPPAIATLIPAFEDAVRTAHARRRSPMRTGDRSAVGAAVTLL